MRTERIVLDQTRGVVLYAYLNHWTSATFGGYPRRGAVIVCPGGAFMVHAGSEGEPVAMAFAGSGYQTFLLRYSLGRHAAIPAPIVDAALAVACVRDHAEEWNIDPDKIALCGFSAGGYVASALGTMYNQPEIQELAGRNEEDIRPNALILGYPLTLVEPLDNKLTRLLSGNRVEAERFARYSPVNNVGPHTPPTFLWNIFADTMIPVETGLAFCAALAANDVPFELHTFQSGSHGCGLGTPVTSLGSARLEDDQVAHWFELCCQWLSNLFGPPQLPPDAVIGFEMPTGQRAHLGENNLPDSLE